MDAAAKKSIAPNGSVNAENHRPNENELDSPMEK